MDELSKLALKYGTDKGPSTGHHDYTRYYHRYFAPIRKEVKSILELGVHTGASLGMWRDYFQNAKIYGLDFAVEVSREYLEQLDGEERLNVLIGNQHCLDDLECLTVMGAPFDIVIDDASHSPNDYLFSLNYLWEHTRSFYVIEDIDPQFFDETFKAVDGIPMVTSELIPSACSDRMAIVLHR